MCWGVNHSIVVISVWREEKIISRRDGVAVVEKKKKREKLVAVPTALILNTGALFVMFEDDRRLGEWEKWWKEGHARNRHTHTQTNKKKNGEFAFKIIKTQEARPPATSKHILFIFIECLFGKQCVSVGLKGCHNTARAPGEHNNKRRSPQRYLSQTCGSFFFFYFLMEKKEETAPMPRTFENSRYFSAEKLSL